MAASTKHPFRVLAALAVAALAACGRDPAGSGAGAGPTTRGGDAVEASIRAAATPLAGTAADYDPLLARIGDARVVLLGEATHGTHEFYRERARISLRLMRERGFDAVAIEGDWPDAARVNRYVRGQGADATPEAALGAFERFPRWMWRNAEVRELVREMRALNTERSADAGRVGFYGLDLYSLDRSAAEVVRYLESVDPAAAERARARYRCFAPFAGRSEEYGHAARDAARSCERAATEQLAEVARLTAGRGVDEDAFGARQNAQVVRNAEAYYRLSAAGANGWNLRDRHMAESLDSLAAHLTRRNGRPARIAVWAHNSHVGDARATAMGAGGDLNIGQLARERWGRDGAVLVGFSTYSGTVTAADDWDQPGRRRDLRPALAESYEAALHRSGVGNALLVLRGPVAEAFTAERPQRAVGVVYRPETERASHYFGASPARQFDVLIHWDVTRAVEPIAGG